MDNCKLTLIRNGSLLCTWTSPWPSAFSLTPHSQAHMAGLSPAQDHTNLLSTPSLFSVPSLPRDLALTFHLPKMTFPLRLYCLLASLISSGYTHLLNSFLFVVLKRDTVMVMAEFQNQCSHVHTNSHIVFLRWKLPWSTYLQNILFLI